MGVYSGLCDLLKLWGEIIADILETEQDRDI